MTVRPINAINLKKYIKGLDVTLPYDEQDKDDVIRQVCCIIDNWPTLTPPNEPLPVLINDETDRQYIDYICPRCEEIISQRRRGQRMETVYQCKYHDNCGQRVAWSSPQPYRRPPEGEEDT